jgi:hypothetical protein
VQFIVIKENDNKQKNIIIIIKSLLNHLSHLHSATACKSENVVRNVARKCGPLTEEAVLQALDLISRPLNCPVTVSSNLERHRTDK